MIRAGTRALICSYVTTSLLEVTCSRPGAGTDVSGLAPPPVAQPITAVAPCNRTIPRKNLKFSVGLVRLMYRARGPDYHIVGRMPFPEP